MSKGKEELHTFEYKDHKYTFYTEYNDLYMFNWREYKFSTPIVEGDKKDVFLKTLVTKYMGKNNVFVLPPYNGGKKSLEWARDFLINNNEKIIEIETDSYARLKTSKSKDERIQRMSDVYYSAKVINAPQELEQNSKLVFVDDILTSGITTLFALGVIQNKFGIKIIDDSGNVNSEYFLAIYMAKTPKKH